MDYVILDLEWNQCPQGKNRENPRLPFEIIEIGAIKLNEAMEEIGRFDEVIRPLVYRTLHYRTREVVSLSRADFSHARTFSPVVRDFIAWCGEDYKFVTWGEMDLSELQRNMDYYRIPIPFPKPLFYYNLQKLYSLLYGDGKSRLALEDAVDALGIEKPIPFHRAIDDTYYTAEIMRRMDLSTVIEYESIDYHRLPETRQEEIYRDFPTYSKYVSRPFASKEEAMQDKAVISMKCSVCGLPMLRRIRWFAAGGSTYLALCQCARHGYIKGKIRLKRTADGQTFVVKTIKPADEESVKRMREKQERLRERRREREKRKRRRSRENPAEAAEREG